MSRAPRHCSCGNQLGKGNTSGRCLTCANRAKAADPAFRERHRAGVKRALALDPARLDKLRAHVRGLAKAPAVVERRTRYMRENAKAMNARSIAAKTPESWAKAGRTVSAKRLAWCPPELRDDYKALVNGGYYTAAEAREVILEQHEREMERFRRRIAA